MSNATKCVPYEVVFGRYSNLPYDVIFDTVTRITSAHSSREYLKDLKVQLIETWKSVSEGLNVSRSRMQKQYNREIKFFDYKVGEKVWIKKKTYKPGENRKLCRPEKQAHGLCFENAIMALILR